MRETSRTLGNGLTTTTSWRDDNRVDAIANPAVGTYGYGYDVNGNRTGEAISGAMSGFGWSTGVNGYDKEDRLVNWDRTDGNLSHDWNLSDVGDWNSLITNGVAEARAHGPAHEVTAVGGQAVTYDAKGNITDDDQGRGYVWDADNHLESVTVSSGAAVGVPGTHSYEYDALGRRVSKTSGGITTVFVSLTVPIPPLGGTGGQVITEYTAGAVTESPLRETVYGSYVDEPMAIVDGTIGDIHYYHQNVRYDVVALSNASGAIAERYAYDAYGNSLILDGTGATQRIISQYGNRYGFTSRELDDKSGLYYFRARYYDSQLGRFVGRDPNGYPEGINKYTEGMNLYAAYFVPEDVDPSGEVPISCECELTVPSGHLQWNTERKTETIECDGLASTCCETACGGDWYPSGDWDIVGQQPDVDAAPLCERAPWDQMSGMDCFACCIEQNSLSAMVQLGIIGMGGAAGPPLGIKPPGRVFGPPPFHPWRYHPRVSATSSWRNVAVKSGFPSTGRLANTLKFARYGGYGLIIAEGGYDVGLMAYCACACGTGS